MQQTASFSTDKDNYTLSEAGLSLLLAVALTAIPAGVAFLNLSV